VKHVVVKYSRAYICVDLFNGTMNMSQIIMFSLSGSLMEDYTERYLQGWFRGYI